MAFVIERKGVPTSLKGDGRVRKARRIPSLDDELLAWSQLGMESVARFFESMHDHGYHKNARGRWISYPSGKTGEICRTCGKLIEPNEW